MDIPMTQTPRLLLRAWTAEDADLLCDILEEDGILRYFSEPKAPPRAETYDYIAHHMAHWDKYGYGHWAVVTQDDGQLVGWDGLEYLPELEATEVAYLLSKRVWGHGYATEAARAAIRFGFESAGLEKIIGLVHPENTGSVRVLEKCGMAFVDRLTLWGLEMSRYQIERRGQGTAGNGRQ